MLFEQLGRPVNPSAALPPAVKTPMDAYFNLGPQLVEEFQGTYEFKYKRIEYVRDDGVGYIVRSLGDESPRTDRIVVKDGEVRWVLGSSGEIWFLLKAPLRVGDQWQHTLRGSTQRYRVASTEMTVSVPAGDFRHCARVEVTWVARKHDETGLQKRVIYLAPNLGIIKQEAWSNGMMWHEEVLTAYKKGG